jgi:hypothetical protein
VEWKLSSLAPWFLFLFLLTILDILTTNPVYESNPFTLYMWAQMGVFLSAWIKIGQVLFLGVLCISAKKIAKPTEWLLAKKTLLAVFVILVSFYIFVVTWNLFTHLTRFSFR